MPDVSGEQAYLAFPDGHSDAGPTTHIRSTLIMSSRKTLRDADLFAEYEALLTPLDQRTLLETTTPTWLPVELGIAHYEACDALNLGANRVAEIAQNLAKQRKGTFLGVAVGIAAGIGVTPWTALSQAERIWRRAWQGGAIGAQKVGEKEARIEVVDWPCARISYCRHALRGILLGVAKLLTPHASVHEIQSLQRDSSAAYRLTWTSSSPESRI